ncbi:hypothetical protein QBC39DRAFT_7412 [Podospora conica]|nr:hypothetical protein QBC39DRAFT_7412 [Schizothecium conicum]
MWGLGRPLSVSFSHDVRVEMAAHDHADGPLSRASRHFSSHFRFCSSGSSGCCLGGMGFSLRVSLAASKSLSPFHRSPTNPHPPFRQNLSQNKSPRGSARSTGCGRHLLISGTRPDDPLRLPAGSGRAPPPPFLRAIPCRRVGGYAGMRWQSRTTTLAAAAAAAGPERPVHALAPLSLSSPVCCSTNFSVPSSVHAACVARLCRF